MKALCLSASNMAHSKENSTSLLLCGRMASILEESGVLCEIADLRGNALQPCTGCGGCYPTRRCCCDEPFNRLYERIIQADCLVIVSPHYAPIPAKLCMLLEKMEEITFLHWWKDPDYRSEVYGLPTAIISHGGGADWALPSYRAMVNDTIANALDTIQCQVVPFNEQQPTGLALSVQRILEQDSIFPVQTYDWPSIDKQLRAYADRILRHEKSR